MQEPNLKCEECDAKFYTASPRLHVDTSCQFCGGKVKEAEDGRRKSTASRR